MDDRNSDLLGEVLETLRFRGSVFFRSRLAAPWGMVLEASANPRFHIALHGECVVGTEGGKAPVKLQEMEILVIPGGDPHWIADRPGRPLVPSRRAGAACELGEPLFQQGRITNQLICGQVEYEARMGHPLLDSLPPLLHFGGITAEDPVWLTVRLMDAEMERGAGQRSAVVDRLVEVLFLQLLNRHLELDETRGFLAALGDRRMRRALELIHRQPEQPWTLEALGARAGMSRATLIRRFNRMLGQSPQSYLAHWRLMKAHRLVSRGELGLEEIAGRVGFASARTLSRAFRRKFGITPSALRRG